MRTHSYLVLYVMNYAPPFTKKLLYCIIYTNSPKRNRRKMNISATKSAIVAFSPIGLIGNEHARTKEKNGHSIVTNQQFELGAHKRKNEYDCAQLMKKSDSVQIQNKTVNKSANVCFGGFFNIMNSPLAKKGLEVAADNGALFAAGFAVFTGFLLRPATILVTPGVQKENKEYACAKSISSSLIGFGIMAALSTPISRAIKKIDQNPAKYLKESTIKNLSDGADLIKASKYKFSTQLFKLGADFASALPKAALTCALIPPLMLCLFPKRKQTPASAQMVCFKSGAINDKSAQVFKSFIKEG